MGAHREQVKILFQQLYSLRDSVPVAGEIEWLVGKLLTSIDALKHETTTPAEKSGCTRAFHDLSHTLLQFRKLNMPLHNMISQVRIDVFPLLVPE